MQTPISFKLRSAFGNDKGQKRNRSGSLDGQCQLPLVDGAIPRNSPRHDFAPLRDKIPQGHGIFVITFYRGICAESTELPAMEKFFLGPRWSLTLKS
jgi:hypothetical protein